MNAIANSLRCELRDREYSEGYAESFLNSYVATQIRVLREQRGLSQPQLASLIGTTQPGISRIENVNYSSWNVGTLKKLARAFNVRLKVSFEPYGTLPEEVETFSREPLQRPAREDDPGLRETSLVNQLVAARNISINPPAKFEYNFWPNDVWNTYPGNYGNYALLQNLVCRPETEGMYIGTTTIGQTESIPARAATLNATQVVATGSRDAIAA